ncbi:MAG: plasmid pRiA4b ORF-3 family protein, partial [bacterium]|nr:plasmid pRiA4b ORF-3 family protein [bacterium]
MFAFYFGRRLFDPENEYSANPMGEHMPLSMGPSSKSAVTAQIRDLELTENTKFLYLYDYGDEL